MFWYLQHLRNLPDLAAWSEPDKTRFHHLAMILVMVTSIVGNFSGRGRRPAARLPPDNRPDVRGLFPRDDRPPTACRGTIGACSGWLVSADRRLPGGFRPVHDVPAAAVPHAAADHRGRLLLQHRPDRGRLGTVFFGVLAATGNGGLLADVESNRLALLYSSVLFLPAAAAATLLPEPPDEVETIRDEG